MTSLALPSPKSVAWSLLSFVAATFWAVLIWLAFLSAVTIGTPPPAPQCRAIHDGEVLVASTLHPDGSLTCTYTEASAIYGRATIKRAGK